MRKHIEKRTWKVAYLAVALILPSHGHAIDYSNIDSYNSSFGADLAKLNGAVGPASKAFEKASKNPLAATAADLSKKFEEAKKILEQSKKQTKWRGEVEASQKEIDAIEKVSTALDTKQRQILDEAKASAEKERALLGQAGRGARPTQSADFDLSSFAEECQVNTSAAKSQFDLFTSKPFQDLQQNGLKMVAEEDERLKKERLENFAKLVEHFEKQAREDEPPATQQNIAALADKNNPLAAASFSLESNLASLDKKRKEKKEEAKDARSLFAKQVFKEFIPKFTAKNQSEDDRQKLLLGMRDNMKAYNRVTRDAMVAAANKSYKRCTGLRKQVGRDTSKRGTMMGEAYVAARQFYGNRPGSYADTTFKPEAEAVGKTFKCEKVAPAIEADFAALDKEIDTIPNFTDPTAAMQNILRVSEVVSQKATDTPKQLKKSVKLCDKISKEKENIQSFMGLVSGGGAAAGGETQSASGAAAPAPRSQGLRPAAPRPGNPATHGTQAT